MARNFSQIAEDMVELQAKKNHDYDNAFEKSMDRYGLVVALIRISDKVSRIHALHQHEVAHVTDESMIDTLTDLAAYALMTVEWIENRK